MDITIDADGRVVDYSAGEAARANLSRWRVLGRDFFRELAWTVGAEAAERIAAFHAGATPRERVSVGEVCLELRRADDGAIAVTINTPARASVRRRA